MHRMETRETDEILDRNDFGHIMYFLNEAVKQRFWIN